MFYKKYMKRAVAVVVLHVEVGCSKSEIEVALFSLVQSW